MIHVLLNICLCGIISMTKSGWKVSLMDEILLQGISLLDLKNNTLLMYMCNLAATTLLKLNGKSINGHPVIGKKCLLSS